MLKRTRKGKGKDILEDKRGVRGQKTRGRKEKRTRTKTRRRAGIYLKRRGAVFAIRGMNTPVLLLLQ